MEYVVVDVFAERPLEGNPLTVFPDAAGLTDAHMQALARETNHSETTFITGPPDETGAVPTRIFTPQTELPFAGHPTLGTAFVANAPALSLAVGRIPVEHDGDMLWMTQQPAAFGPMLDAKMASQALGVPVIHAEVVGTGTPMALMQVANSEAVRAARLTPEKYVGPQVACAYVFALDSDYDIHARSFGAFVGVSEDPATGSAAGPVAAWLHRAGLLGGGRTIHQGVEMKRPSQLHIAGTADAPRVGGKVQRVATGQFTIPETTK